MFVRGRVEVRDPNNWLAMLPRQLCSRSAVSLVLTPLPSSTVVVAAADSTSLFLSGKRVRFIGMPLALSCGIGA